METQLKKVKAKDLVPGMALREITQFSADYSYLDSATIEFLQRRFRGASAVVNAQGATKTVPIEALQPLNRLEAIIDLPPAPGTLRSALDFSALLPIMKRCKGWGEWPARRAGRLPRQLCHGVVAAPPVNAAQSYSNL